MIEGSQLKESPRTKYISEIIKDACAISNRKLKKIVKDR